MLSLERARTELFSLLLLTRVGLVALVLGGLADVAAHLEAPGHGEHERTAPELLAHLVGFLGMVVILLGVVLDGVRRTYRSRPGGNAITPAIATSTPRA